MYIYTTYVESDSVHGYPQELLSEDASRSLRNYQQQLQAQQVYIIYIYIYILCIYYVFRLCIWIRADASRSHRNYGVATISTLLRIIGLFRKRAL